MLRKVAGAEEAGDEGAAGRRRRCEERERGGLGQAGVEHGVGAGATGSVGFWGPGWDLLLARCPLALTPCGWVTAESGEGFWVAGARHVR